jgi:hypothetical protein
MDSIFLTDNFQLQLGGSYVYRVFPPPAGGAAGDDYVPQAWNKYMEGVQKWSDDMIEKSLNWHCYGRWGADLPAVEAAAKKAA